MDPSYDRLACDKNLDGNKLSKAEKVGDFSVPFVHCAHKYSFCQEQAVRKAKNDTHYYCTPGTSYQKVQRNAW